MFNLKTPADLRNEKKVSREEVANAVGLSLFGYVNIELGNREPSFKTAKRLAQYFGVPLESIKFGSDIKASLNCTGTEGRR